MESVVSTEFFSALTSSLDSSSTLGSGLGTSFFSAVFLDLGPILNIIMVYKSKDQNLDRISWSLDQLKPDMDFVIALFLQQASCKHVSIFIRVELLSS